MNASIPISNFSQSEKDVLLISKLLGFEGKRIEYDFNSYSRKKFFNSKSDEMKVRYENLKDVIETFNKHRVCYWLYGKTLWGMYKNGKLLENDHDEDIGVADSNIAYVCRFVYPDLVKKGFTVIRATENSMLTVMRNNRYLDICFFRDYPGGQRGYEKKRVLKEYLE